MSISLGLSLALSLGLTRSLLLASLRMVLQLSLLGLILNGIFTRQSPWEVLGLALLMTLAAGWTAVSRVKHPYRGLYRDGLLAIALSSWLMTATMLTVVQQPQPWFLPQLLIPTLGMILGNGLSGMALALDRFLEQLQLQREQIEGALLLGATRWEATRALFRDCLRTGLMPTTNAMLAAGLVSLPGMMTGQILGGADPQQAARYQMVIFFLILSSTALGTGGLLWLAWRQLLPPERLALERLHQPALRQRRAKRGKP
ncbi:MAG: iron export ABC transporter permease subunit FetB [Candidatus Sericytochromatia bacterium]|nr:iron export ABC transporter permease subunit FetB [Candidatus Sericytochromatia bacterium]